MKITIEKSFLASKNMDDELFLTSLIGELEEVIEEELAKDIKEMNTDLIDDCCIAIENLQNALTGEENNCYELISGVERIIRQRNKKLRNVCVAAVACAAVAAVCAVTSVKLANRNTQVSLRPNSSIDDVFNVHEHTVTNPETTEKEYTTKVQKEEPTTSVTNETTTAVSQVTENQVTGEILPPSTMPVPHIYKLEVIIPPGGDLEFVDKSQIDLTGFFVKVYYTNAEKIVSIDECDVEIGTPDANGKTKVTITYNHMYTSIYVNIVSKNEKNSE